ncbi:MAG: metal-dependent hydrolase [Anaerolineae bacterium]|nr:metal-dependent hydrolase [Anaerolineae bacterium]
MPQAGIHSMAGMAVRKWTPNKKWLMLGIVLGSLLPDGDNFAVAIATVTGGLTEPLHRTLTHSLFFIAAIVIVFYGIAWLSKRPKWGNLGLGLGIGVLMHVLLDLVGWFNGVHLLWPLTTYVNFWGNVSIPEWWTKLMSPIENLFFALYFLLLASAARKRNTDSDYLPKLRKWTWVQGILFVAFLVMVYTMKSGFLTIFGAVYLFSLGLAFAITIRMRKTVEALAN